MTNKNKLIDIIEGCKEFSPEMIADKILENFTIIPYTFTLSPNEIMFKKKSRKKSDNPLTMFTVHFGNGDFTEIYDFCKTTKLPKIDCDIERIGQYRSVYCTFDTSSQKTLDKANKIFGTDLQFYGDTMCNIGYSEIFKKGKK